MAIKSKNFMNSIKAIVRDCGPLVEWESWSEPDELDSHISVNGGESYDGFINFTDGFINRCVPYVPLRDEHLTFKGFNKATRKNAKDVQKVLDYLENTDSIVENYFDWNLEDDFKSTFENGKKLTEWYNSYIPRQSHYEQLGLFNGGKPVETVITDPKLDKLYFDIQDFCDDYYSEACAFVGITVRLYDTDNWRNNTDKKTCIIESYFNDDLSYGRESVGNWAGKNCIGKHFGKQVIYSSEFTWNNKKDLVAKLNRRIGKAYDSLGR